MPSTYNGIGTLYRGKKDLETEYGTCENCGRNVELQTYETSLYFVVLFIPVIPLGKKQILDMCPRCTKHKAVDVGKWRLIRDQAIQDSAQMLTMRMNDPKVAVEHLQTLTAFRQMSDARELVPAIETTHQSDINVQLYLGSWLEKYGEKADSDRCFNRAFELNPKHPGSIRARAVGLMEQQLLDDAQEMLAAIDSPSPEYDPTLFCTLADKYGNQGRNEQAMAVYRRLVVNAPELMKEKEFRKVVRKTEKAAGLKKSILSRKPMYEFPAFWAVACTLFLAIGGMMLMMQRANNRFVHIINGLPTAMTISIDGCEPFEIRAEGWVGMKIPEGEHRVSVVSPAGFEDQSFSMKTSALARLFQTPVFVLDPSQTGMVYVEKTVYSENPDDNAEGDFNFQIGKLFQTFDGIDFVFKPFPDEIKVDAALNEAIRQRVDFHSLDPDFFLTGEIETDGDTQFGLTERILTAKPDDIELWRTYAAIGVMQEDISRCVAFVKPQLSVEPLNVELHRYYQDISEQDTTGNPTDLIREYETRLDADPENADLIYLRGRLEQTVSGSKEYMERVLAINSDHVRAMMALAYEKNCTGEHFEAVELLRRAIELDPENVDLREQYQDALFAARDFDSLETEMSETPQSYQDLLNQMNYLVKSKQFRKLKTLRVAYMEEAGETGGLLFDIHDKYLVKKFEEMQELSGQLPQPRFAALFGFYATLELGELEDARRHFDQLEIHHGDFELLLAIALHHAGSLEESEKIRASYIEDRLKTGSTDAAFARLLAECDARVVGVEEIRDLSIEPDRKRVFAIAIREFSAEADPELDEEVRMLNYNYSFPYHFINSCLKPESSVTAGK